MGRIRRMAGLEAHDVHPIQMADDRRTATEDVGGQLLKITPYRENEGIASAAGLYKSMYDPHEQNPHAIEIWHYQGKIQFVARVASENIADNFRRRVATNYHDSTVTEMNGGVGFPAIEAGDYVAATDVQLENPLTYLPIRHYKDKEGFDFDPYEEVLESMVAGDETRIVVQCVLKAMPKTWTSGGLFGSSVGDVAERFRKPKAKGWINIREVEASKKDRYKAEVVEEQRQKPAFDTALRVLAISPDPHDAASRAGNIGQMYANYYNAQTEQGLKSVPVDGRCELTQRRKVSQFIDRMRYRQFTSSHMILTVPELASAAHIPSGDVGVPNIDWKYSKSGTEIPADAPHPDTDP